MKKTPLFAALLALLCFLSACGKAEPVALLPEGIDMEDNAVELFRWDGRVLQSQFVFGPPCSEILAVLADAAGTPGKAMEPPEDGEVCWGFVLSFEWEDFEAAWCDGVWSDSDGKNLRVDLDFDALWEMGGGEVRERDLNGGAAPFMNSRLLALRDGAWEPAFLSKSEAADTDPDVSLTCEPGEERALACTFRYHGAGSLTFGEYYWPQVQVDGDWYYVPADTGHYSFTDIGLRLGPGETYEFSPWLDPYLPLPDGNYRIAKSYDGGLATAEFLIVNGTIQVP